MKTKRKSIIDLAKEVGNHALSISPVEGTLSCKGKRYESGTTVTRQYLFSFPQGEATDSTSHNIREEESDSIENGANLFIYRLKNPALEIIYRKKNESSATLQIAHKGEKSSLEVEANSLADKQTQEQNKNFYTLSDSSKELYKYLVEHNSSPGSLAFLAKTHIEMDKKEVYVPDAFTQGRIKTKYGEAIERRLNSKVKYIVEPELMTKKLIIDLKNL